MSSIPSLALPAGVSPRQTALSDAQASPYVRKQSLSTYESLDAGLVIKTKQGDFVTLTSSTYSQFEGSMYDSRGVLQTDSSESKVNQDQRDITLASGEQFSFSVEGDLSNEELEDIEDIVRGIDEIIAQMVAGQMDDAVSKALAMGGYDTVSMYSADITYQRSYTMTSRAQAETANSNPMNTMDKFVDDMVKKMGQAEEKLLDKARKPVDKLFRHHLKGLKNNKGDDQAVSIYNDIDSVRKKIREAMDEMAKNIFKDRFSAFFT